MAYTPTTWVDGSEPAITATRLKNIETGIVQAHELLDTVTSAATADALVKRDSAGRTKFAQGAGTGDAVVIPVPVTALKRAQGSFSGASGVFQVHQFAFGSPYTSRGQNSSAYIDGIGRDANLADAGRGWWLIVSSSSDATVTWDYLTASGHPSLWAEVDEAGNIVSIWEAEDPADPEFPDDPPFEPGDGRVVIPVEAPDVALLTAVGERLDRAAMPTEFGRSIYAADPPPRAARAMFARQLRERGLEEPPDIREALSIQDRDRRYWYLQLYLRQASRLLHGHRSSTLIPLYREMCRVDPTSGRLQPQ